MEIDVNIAAPTVAEALRVGRCADELGAVNVGVWDSPTMTADAWTTLGALSQHVRRARLGVMVTNPVTRHPVVTAAAAATLARAAPGGACLGIGSGDSGVRNLGASPASLAELRTYVTCVRELLRDGESRWRDERVFLADPPPPGSVPVYVAAHGTAAVEVAAATADGLLAGLGVSQDVVTAVLDATARTVASSGRAGEAFDVRWVLPGVCVDPEPGRAPERVGWLLASFAHHYARRVPPSALVPEPLREAVQALGARYVLTRHGRQPQSLRAAYVTAARELGVWDYLSDRLLVAGTPAEVTARLSALEARGVRSLQLVSSVGVGEGFADVLTLAGGPPR